MTLTEKLDRLPPYVARLLAKETGRLATVPELMAKTGWGRRKIEALQRAMTWKKVAVGDVDIFLKACGLTWSAQRRQLWLIQLAIQRGGIDRMKHFRLTDGFSGSQIRSQFKRIEKMFKESK
jgi:hypothetical protein